MGVIVTVGRLEEIHEDNIDFVDLRTLSKVADENIYTLASKAKFNIVVQTNQHCGICGSKMYKKIAERKEQ